MIRTVTIAIDIDFEDYDDAEDTPEGAIDLVTEMLEDRTDFSCSVIVSCGAVTRRVDL